MLDEKLSLKKRATIRNNRLIYRRDNFQIKFLIYGHRYDSHYFTGNTEREDAAHYAN